MIKKLVQQAERQSADAEEKEQTTKPPAKKRKVGIAMCGVAKLPATTPFAKVREVLTMRVESDDKKFLDTRRKHLVERVGQSRKKPIKSKRRDATYEPLMKKQRKLDREIAIVQKKAEAEDGEDKENENTNPVAEMPNRVTCESQEVGEILRQGTEINADYVNEFFDHTPEDLPRSEVSQCVLLQAAIGRRMGGVQAPHER